MPLQQATEAVSVVDVVVESKAQTFVWKLSVEPKVLVHLFVSVEHIPLSFHALVVTLVVQD